MAIDRKFPSSLPDSGSRNRQRRSFQPANDQEDSGLELQQIDHFVSLARTNDLGRAASLCETNRQSLSRSIRRLESDLGGRLFRHEHGLVEMTELGRLMFPYFTSIHDNCWAAKSHAQSASRLELGMLRIGAMCTISPHLIAGFISQFKSRYPGIQVSVIDGSAEETLDMLRGNEVDVALLGLPYEAPAAIYQIPIFEERFVIVLPSSHPLCAKEAVSAADLHSADYVGRIHCEALEPVMHALDKRGIVMNLVFSSSRDDWAQSMIKTGLGLGFFPEYAVTDPDVVVRPLIEPSFSRVIKVATLHGESHSPAVGAFLQEARRYPWRHGLGKLVALNAS